MKNILIKKWCVNSCYIVSHKTAYKLSFNEDGSLKRYSKFDVSERMLKEVERGV